MISFVSLILLVTAAHAVLFEVVDVKTSKASLCMDRIPTNYHHLDDRIKLSGLLNERNFTIGVEVGVQKGIFSKATLKGWKKNQKYYMVDVWHTLSASEKYKDSANVNNKKQQKIYEEAAKNVKEFGDRGILIRNYSTNAAKYFPDLSVDYVYIDARHDYCGVYEDLEAWWPKLKIGGIFAGHDYLTEPEAHKLNKIHGDWALCSNGSVIPSAVKGAVLKFAQETAHTKVYSTTEDWPTWFYSPKGLNHDTDPLSAGHSTAGHNKTASAVAGASTSVKV